MLLPMHPSPNLKLPPFVLEKPASRASLMAELPVGTTQTDDYEQALAELKPDAVCISTYPDTHYPFAKMALNAVVMYLLKNPWLKVHSNARNWSIWPGHKARPWWWGTSCDSTPVGLNLWRLPKPWENHWSCG